MLNRSVGIGMHDRLAYKILLDRQRVILRRCSEELESPGCTLKDTLSVS